MSFFRSPFRNFVRDQFERRIELLNEGKDKTKRSHQWYANYLSKTSFVRVAPLVRIIDPLFYSNFGANSENSIKDATNFTKNFVLEGTPLLYDKENNLFKKGAQFPSNLNQFISSQDPSNPFKGNRNTLLNNPILRTSPDNDGFGIVPPPGVTDFSINTKSFYGNLREAKLSIRCFSIKQFEYIEKLYSRPGHHVLVEWGWTQYIDNETGRVVQMGDLISNPENNDFWGDTVEAGYIYQDIEEKKRTRSGCYDGFLGIVKNFTSKVETDGGFSLSIQLIGRGDLLDSLKLDREGDIEINQGGSDSAYKNYLKFSSPNAAVEDDTLTRYTADEDEQSNQAKEIKEKSQEYDDNQHSNLRNLLVLMANQTIYWSFNGPGIYSQINDLPNFLRPKRNFDLLQLYDPSNESVRNDQLSTTTEEEDGVATTESDQSNRPVKGREIGLGPYIRLGYLLKLINNYCVPLDGNENPNPLITINNLLYTKDFNPENNNKGEDFKSEGATHIYPSCYSTFNFESDIKKNLLMKEIFNRVNNIMGGEALNTEGANPPVEPEDQETYRNSIGRLPNPGYIESLRKKLLEKYNSIMPSKDGLTIKGNTGDYLLDQKIFQAKLDLEYKEFIEMFTGLTNLYLKNAGSCIPSKILFPHQFQPQELKQQDFQNDTSDLLDFFSAVNTITTYGGLTDFFGISQTLDDQAAALRSNPQLYYNLYNLNFYGFLGEDQPERYNLGNYIKDKVIPSDWWAGSYASKAFNDSLILMRKQNKISQNYFARLANIVRANGSSLYGEKKLREYHESLVKETNGLYDPTRVIDNISLNIFWLEGLIGEKEDITIGDFLKKICDTINEASGGSTDLKVIDSPVFNNQISIIDFNINSNSLCETQNDQFKFSQLGKFSIFKELSITGKIPDAQASTIAIAAQAPRNANTIESVTYKAFLDDVEDRIAKPPQSFAAQARERKQRQEKEQREFEIGVKKWERTFLNYVSSAVKLGHLYGVLNFEAGHKDKEWFTNLEDNAKSSAKYLNKNGYFLSYSHFDSSPIKTHNTSLPITNIIPLKIKITTEGISGILASNTFKLDKGILPDKYNQDRISYVINKETQQLKNMMWETSIEGSIVLDNECPPKQNFKTPKYQSNIDRSKAPQTQQTSTALSTQDAEAIFEEDNNLETVPSSEITPKGSEADQWFDVTRTLTKSAKKSVIDRYGWPIEVKSDGSKVWGKIRKVRDRDTKTQNVYHKSKKYKKNIKRLNGYKFENNTNIIQGGGKPGVINISILQDFYPTVLEILEGLKKAKLHPYVEGFGASWYTRDVTTEEPKGTISKSAGNLSGHSFGIAIDINANVFPIGSKGTQKYKKAIKDPKNKDHNAARVIKWVIDNYVTPSLPYNKQLYHGLSFNDAHHFSFIGKL